MPIDAHEPFETYVTKNGSSYRITDGQRLRLEELRDGVPVREVLPLSLPPMIEDLGHPYEVAEADAMINALTERIKALTEQVNALTARK